LNNKILAIIPARGGSQGVKNKNKKKLGGKPLILHTVEFAKDYGLDFLVSTDDAEIVKIVYGINDNIINWKELEDNQLMEVNKQNFLHKRSPEDAKSNSLISDLLFKLSSNNALSEKYKYFLLLQPTSPFREKDDLRGLLQYASGEEENWSSIFSAKDVGGFHPNRMYRIGKDKKVEQIDKSQSGENIPRQELEKVYIKDGSYYLFKIENLQKKFFLGTRPLIYILDRPYSVNIDSPLDFLIAETIFGKAAYEIDC